MKTISYVRKGSTITEITTGNKTEYRSINAAKRASRKLSGVQAQQPKKPGSPSKQPFNWR